MRAAIYWILFVFLFVFVSAARAEIKVSATTLDFGTVNQGMAKTMPLKVSNDAKEPVTVKIGVSAPFTASPETKTFAGGEAIEVTVILPATVSAGGYKAKLMIQPDTASVAAVGVMVGAKVAAPAPTQDLSATFIFFSEQVTGTNRTAVLRVNAKTSVAAPVAAKMQLFGSGDNGPSTKFFDQTVNYTQGGNVFDVNYTFPASVVMAEVKLMVDPGNAVAETNETNNEYIQNSDFQ